MSFQFVNTFRARPTAALLLFLWRENRSRIAFCGFCFRVWTKIILKNRCFSVGFYSFCWRGAKWQDNLIKKQFLLWWWALMDSMPLGGVFVEISQSYNDPEVFISLSRLSWVETYLTKHFTHKFSRDIRLQAHRIPSPYMNFLTTTMKYHLNVHPNRNSFLSLATVYRDFMSEWWWWCSLESERGRQ